METPETPSFKNIVGELLRRHRHGICAVRLKSGSVEFKTTGQWAIKVGLASLIQHRMCSRGSTKLLDASAVPETQPTSLLDLELATTGQLVNQLRQFPEQWILGLARPTKVGDCLVPTVATKGSPLICAGLAVFIAHSLSQEDRQRHLDKHYPEQDELAEQRAWLSVIQQQIESKSTDMTWMIGLTRGLEFSWLARGG